MMGGKTRYSIGEALYVWDEETQRAKWYDGDGEFLCETTITKKAIEYANKTSGLWAVLQQPLDKVSSESELQDRVGE
jgi:hypothetical protein